MDVFNEYKVRVCCITYNHASYIEDAMNGFCFQKTSFPYVCTIVDDASTDGEQEVIQKYLDEHFVLAGMDNFRRDETDDFVRFYARHKTNTNCHFVVVFLKYNHYSIKKPKAPYIKDWTNSKYVALCEGDDYWIDEHKLEKQVDFLEHHPDFSMCFHGSEIILDSDDINKKRLHQFDNLETREYSGEEVARKWITPTASMVFRASIKPPRDPRFIAGDVVLRAQCTIEGKIFCFADKMSVYRINNGGLTKRQGYFDFNRSIPHIKALADHFPQYTRYYKDKMFRAIKSGLLSKHMFKALFFLLIHPRYVLFILKKS